MDWNNVTTEELIDALREVDWKAPRPLGEFLSKFSVPKNQSKWTSRLKCNVYYYRTNYLAILVICYVAAFLRNPLSLLAAAQSVWGLLCYNDPFATTLNDHVIWLVRKVHPHSASILRSYHSASQGNIGMHTRSKSSIRIVILPRPLFVGVLLLSSLYLWYKSRGWVMLLVATLIGLGILAAHASFRSPNLKARLASAREEFRAVWRGYQADMSHDYTL